MWKNTQPLTGVPEKEVAARLLEELKTSIRLHKVGDVPVGVALSGGIDSSTNAALFSEGESSDVNTFTIGYDGDYESAQNETHCAELFAKQCNTKHHVRLLSQRDLLAFLPEMIRLQDEPIADPVCVPVYYLCKLVRDNGIKVLQVAKARTTCFAATHTGKCGSGCSSSMTCRCRAR